MPHLTVEYTSNLAAGFPKAEVLRALNQAVAASPEIQNESDLKTRLVALDHFEIGTAPASRAFVHAQLRLLSAVRPHA